MDGDALQSVSSDESILTCPVCNRQNIRNKFTCIDIDAFKNLNLGKLSPESYRALEHK